MDLVQRFDEVQPLKRPCLDRPKNDDYKPKRKKFTWYFDVRATPLVEIYSVTIHTSQARMGMDKCEIYGQICVHDKSGYTFDLFNKGENVAEGVGADGTLLLSYPSSEADNKNSLNVIVPSEHVSLDVKLFDKAPHGDVVVAQGQLDLKRTVADCKAVQMTERIYGDVGFAEVHYAEFPYAVVAVVDVLYFSPNDDFDLLSDQVKPQDDEDEDGDSDVGSDNAEDRESFDEEDRIDYDTHIYESEFVGLYGTIVARNGLLLSERCDHQDYNNNSSILFRKPRDKSVVVKSGDYVELSRCTVNVPVSSSLKVEVDLSDRDTKMPIAASTVEFKPEYFDVYKKDIVGHNGRIRVRVTWKNANSRISSVPPALPRTYYGFTMVELFSIAVCGNDFQPLSYYGKIFISSGDFLIFDKDAKCPQYCPALGTHVELNCHDIYNVEDGLSVWVILKDANSRSMISKGLLSWRPWREEVGLNRQLCSVIRGEKGFTAVHYAIFEDASSAEVKVKLFGKTTTSRVSGTLLAYYDIPDFYSSSYQKKYYRSIIFHRDGDKGLTLQSDGSSMPLLKSVVMLPKMTSLIFEADLCISPVPEEGDDDSPQETNLTGLISFECKYPGEFRGNISRHDVCIEVSGKLRW